jgi:hypothetical protein
LVGAAAGGAAAVPRPGAGGTAGGLNASDGVGQLADRLGEHAGVGRVADVGLDHGGVGADLVGAQQLVGGRVGQQRLVELGDGGGADPAGELDQGGGMRHPAAQGDAAEPLPGD